MRDFLHECTPIASFLGEEAGGSKSTDGYHWILDPIDGTVNFLHGVPLCAISLSLVLNGMTVTAVIDLPFLDTQYTALRGYGAYANDKKIHVSATCDLNDALISVDQYTFGDDSGRTNQIRHRLIGQLAPRVQRIRMHGTSVIDLAWTAHGRLDACVMLGNKPWDTSAGVLIAREAGARVIDLDDSKHPTGSFATIAVAPSLERDLMTVLRSGFTETATFDQSREVRPPPR